VGLRRRPAALTEEQRVRIWARVERRLRAPRRSTVADRVYAAFELVAAPAPLIARAAASLGLVAALVAGAMVASAEALPQEPLYAVKSSAEQLRLALAVEPGDRVAVELSLSEHRSADAVRLVAQGDHAGAALAATSSAAHVAEAAAALALLERAGDEAPAALSGLAERMTRQQRRSEAAVAALGAAAPAGQAAAAAPSGGTETQAGSGVAGAIADEAASVARRAAAVAERLAQAEERQSAGPREAPGREAAARSSDGASHAAERARDEAERASQAAQRAKHAGPPALVGPPNGPATGRRPDR